ncbi:MAG: TrmH family RNA methyltransferase [Cyanophyceae cyanobacterium]
MLTSLQNPLIKQMRKLHRAKARREQNLYLLEGTHLLQAACDANHSLVTVCCTPQWQERQPCLWQTVSQKAARTELVSPEVLAKLATTVNPDGVVATIPPRTLLASSDLSLGLMLERLQDPGNLGTILRTAVATSTDRLWLSQDSVELHNPKVMRASAGSWFQAPIAHSDNLAATVVHYQQQGTQIVATRPQATQAYWELDWSVPTLILLGNEGAGLSRELVTLADRQVQIPLRNGVESLNVAIAAALLLYEARRQRSLIRGQGE